LDNDGTPGVDHGFAKDGNWLPLLDKARTALLAPSDEVKVQMELLKDVPGSRARDETARRER
jgi:hypothetical protein